MTTPAKLAPEALLLGIALKHFPNIETLETRNRRACTRLDFHDVAVWAIRDALEAALAAGQAAAKR